MEWQLWRRLPQILMVGTVLPLTGLAFLHLGMQGASAAEARGLQILDFVVTGILVFHWTAVLTVGIGCAVVMVMKGPAYEADSYPLPDGDQRTLSSATSNL